MFHLWRNQVVGFYWQNIWKASVEEWRCPYGCIHTHSKNNYDSYSWNTGQYLSNSKHQLQYNNKDSTIRYQAFCHLLCCCIWTGLWGVMMIGFFDFLEILQNTENAEAELPTKTKHGKFQKICKLCALTDQT